jgi:hypothetical protein
MIFRLVLACGLLLGLPSSSAMAAITMTGPASVGETSGAATYTVTCGGELTDIGVLTVSVDGGPDPGATVGEDYESPSALPITCVALVPSEHTIEVPIINDGDDEPTENLTVSAGPLPSPASRPSCSSRSRTPGPRTRPSQ